MKKIFSEKRKIFEILFPLILVFIAIGYYYLVYIPNKEAEIVERKFRTLRLIEENSSEKIAGIKNIIQTSIEAFRENEKRSTENKNGKRNDTLQNELDKEKKLILKVFNSLPLFTISFESKMSNHDTSLIGLKFIPEEDALEITIIDSNSTAVDTTHFLKVKATVNYKYFIEPLIRRGIFDDYTILSKGKVLFETTPSGFTYNNVDSLFRTTNGIYYPKTIPLELGGKKFIAFLQPAGFNNKPDLIIVGLLKQQTIESEKRSLPQQTFTWIIIITLASLFLLPFLKLVLLGKKERLNLRDLFSTYLSLLFISALLFFLIFYNCTDYFAPKDNDEKSRIKLTSEISSSFRNDMYRALIYLDTLDGYYHNNSSVQSTNITNLYNPGKSSKVKPQKGDFNKSALLPHDSANLFLLVVNYTSLSKIFWLDSVGKEVAHWYSGKNDYPLSHFEMRNYFLDLKTDTTICLENDPLKRKFAFEPVISRVDGQFKIVISKKSKHKNLTTAIACTPISTIEPVLPAGYGFVIFRNDGKVVLHSNKYLNLNENLFEELSARDELKSALHTLTRKSFYSHYNGHQYRFTVEPINNLPLFIAVFSDTVFDSTLKIETFSFSFSMFLSFFFFLSFELFIIILCHSHQSMLKQNTLDLSWVYPRRSQALKYGRVLIYLISLILLIVVIILKYDPYQYLPDYIFILLLSSVISNIYINCFYQQDESIINFRFNKLSIWLSILFIAILFSAYYYKVETWVYVFAFTSIILFFLPLLLKKVDGKNHLILFRFMVFSKIIFKSALPFFIFFSCGYDFEQHLNARFKLLDYANNIEDYLKKNNDLFRLIILSNQDVELKEHNKRIKFVYRDKNWINTLDTVNAIKAQILIPYKYSKKDSACFDLLKSARFPYGSSLESENMENIESKTDRRYVFNSAFSFPDSLLFRIRPFRSDPPIQQILITSSENLAFCLPNPFHLGKESIFWMLIILALVVIYFLLTYAVRIFFATNIFQTEKCKKILNSEDQTSGSNFTLQSKIKHYFIQGMPGSGKMKVIREALESGERYTNFVTKKTQKEGYYCDFDLIKIPDLNEYNKDNWDKKVSELTENNEIKIIIFNHFEYNINDAHANRLKLNLIEQCMNKGDKVIIIVSTVEPSFYIGSLSKNSTAAKDDKNVQEVCIDLLRWKILLGHFINFYIPLKKIAGKNVHKNVFTNYLTEEYQYGHFLEKIKQVLPVDTLNGVTRLEFEHRILAIQGMAHHFYNYVWSSLTREEQLAVYDLAEDGFMNTTNCVVINMLLFKGLIRPDDGELKLMNRSFRNFILTNIDFEELKQVEKEISDSQSWKDYQYPILIVLSALVWFILSSNPDKFGHVLPALSAIAAGIPAIIKFLSFFNPTEKK